MENIMFLSAGWLILLLSVAGSSWSLLNGTGSRVTCTEGHAQSSTYVRNYTVKKRHVQEWECQRLADIQRESRRPPGKPRIGDTVLEGGDLQITWRPPDDGSVVFLSGFLVELYVEARDYRSGPDACYTIQVTEHSGNLKRKRAIDPDDPLPQDAVFSLSCVIPETQNCTRVAVYVTSFPLPQRDTIKADTDTISAGTCDEDTLRRMSSKSTAPGGGSYLPLITISIGVCVVMIITIIVIVCYKRRNQRGSSETVALSNTPSVPSSPLTNNATTTTKTLLAEKAESEKAVLLHQTQLSDEPEMTQNAIHQLAHRGHSTITQDSMYHKYQGINEEVVQDGHRFLCSRLTDSTCTSNSINTNTNNSANNGTRLVADSMSTVGDVGDPNCRQGSGNQSSNGASSGSYKYQVSLHHQNYQRSNSVPQECYHHRALHDLDTHSHACAYQDRTIHGGDTVTNVTLQPNSHHENDILESQPVNTCVNSQAFSWPARTPGHNTGDTCSERAFPEEFREFAIEVNKET